MADLTAQEIFDKVVMHLRTQGERSSSGAKCLYRSPTGLKCAVGCLITDEEYMPEMDMSDSNFGSSITQLNLRKLTPKRLIPFTDMLAILQQIHDDNFNWSDAGFNSHGEGQMAKLAINFNLTYTEPQP